MNPGGTARVTEPMPWRLILGGTVLGWAVLQILRPRYFLTDDTFTLFFPLLVEVGRSLLAGKAFWISDSIFGGGYNLAADAQMVPLWHPLMLGLSLLAQTPLQSWVMDLAALFNLLAAAGGLGYLLMVLECNGHPPVPRSRAVWLCLSWAFSFYVLMLGSSGIWYLASVAVLPWLVSAALEQRPRRSVGLMAAAVFHGAIAGYPSCFIYSMTLLFFPLVWRFYRAGWKSLLPPLAGMVLGAVLALPLLLPALFSLADSARSQPAPWVDDPLGRFPLPVLLMSLTLGTPAAWAGEILLFGVKAHAYALGVSWVGMVAVLPFFRRSASWSWWDAALVAAFLWVVMLLARPEGFRHVLAQVPLLGSLRWPHKEMFLAVFLLHLWVLRPTLIGGRVFALAAALGVGFWLLPLLAAGMPSLNSHEVSRRLYFSGQAESFWNTHRSLRYAPMLDQTLVDDLSVYPQIPWILLGSHNFAALWDARCWTGYSATLPQRLVERQPRMVNIYGVLAWEDRHAYWQQSPHPVVLLRPAAESGAWTIFLASPGEVERLTLVLNLENIAQH